MNISLSRSRLENLVSRDGFGSPVPRQPVHLHTQAEPGAYLAFLTSSAAASMYSIQNAAKHLLHSYSDKQEKQEIRTRSTMTNTVQQMRRGFRRNMRRHSSPDTTDRLYRNMPVVLSNNSQGDAQKVSARSDFSLNFDNNTTNRLLRLY